MRTIKKYANRKLYDTVDKKYISMTRLAELIKAGEEISVIDNTCGEDITSAVVSKLLAKDGESQDSGVTSRLLIQVLRKGGGTLIDYAKKYTSLWQNALNMADDEIDKLVGMLVKDEEISESDGNRLKQEIAGYTESLRSWINDKVDLRLKERLEKEQRTLRNDLFDYASHVRGRVGDQLEQRVHNVLEMMKLPTRDQVEQLIKRIDMLEEKVQRMEAKDNSR